MNNIGCTTDCQCREDLGLKCRTFSNAYSCYSYFGTGSRCLCNPTTHRWNSIECGNINFNFLNEDMFFKIKNK